MKAIHINFPIKLQQKQTHLLRQNMEKSCIEETKIQKVNSNAPQLFVVNYQKFIYDILFTDNIIQTIKFKTFYKVQANIL